MWTVACEDSIHASGKIRVRWAAPAGEKSSRKDFVALFKVGEESLRKYDQYKVAPRRCAKIGNKIQLADPQNADSQVISKEGLQNGEVTSPPQPNPLLQQAHRNLLRIPHAPPPSAWTIHTERRDARSLTGTAEGVGFRVIPRHIDLNPKPSTLTRNPKPETLNPTTSTLHPQP